MAIGKQVTITCDAGECGNQFVIVDMPEQDIKLGIGWALKQAKRVGWIYFDAQFWCPYHKSEDSTPE